MHDFFRRMQIYPKCRLSFVKKTRSALHEYNELRNLRRDNEGICGAFRAFRSRDPSGRFLNPRQRYATYTRAPARASKRIANDARCNERSEQLVLLDAVIIYETRGIIKVVTQYLQPCNFGETHPPTGRRGTLNYNVGEVADGAGGHRVRTPETRSLQCKR